jgi:hypothetical protein
VHTELRIFGVEEPYFQRTFMHTGSGIDIQPLLHPLLSHYVLLYMQLVELKALKYRDLRHRDLKCRALEVLEGSLQGLRLQRLGKGSVANASNLGIHELV